MTMRPALSPSLALALPLALLAGQIGAAEGDESCRAAIQVFAHRLRKYIGAYAAILGGADAIV